MNIGFVSFYPWRPHVEHLAYLETILSAAGHQSFFLTCDAQASFCYPRLSKNVSKISECPKCIVGGLRSFYGSRVSGLHKKYSASLTEQELFNLTKSSAYTLNRIEAVKDRSLPEVLETQKKLHMAVNLVYGNTCQWINDNNLDAIICFNGRMDMLAACLYAAEQQKISYVTLERAFAGHGLMLKPNENCLGLRFNNRLVEEYDGLPLTRQQAELAASHLASRFIGANELEWRIYNKGRQKVDWPTKNLSGPKVLVLPSSKCEYAGDQQHDFSEDERVYIEAILKKLDASPQQCVLRAHPNWATTMDGRKNTLAEDYYSGWAKQLGIHYIAAAEKANTYDLIQAADIVIVNASTCAIEAGVCGKQVICIGKASYNKASFVQSVFQLEDIERLQFLEPDKIIRSCLRYVYTLLNLDHTKLQARLYGQFQAIKCNHEDND